MGNECKKAGITPSCAIGSSKIEALWLSYDKSKKGVLSVNAGHAFLKDFASATNKPYSKRAADEVIKTLTDTSGNISYVKFKNLVICQAEAVGLDLTESLAVFKETLDGPVAVADAPWFVDLTKAIKSNDMDLFKKTFKKENINEKNRHGQTLLYIAARANNAACCKFLLEAKADPNIKATDSSYALHECCKKENGTECCQLLVEHGANVNVRGRWDFTPLHYAAGKNVVGATKILLEHKADVNAFDKSGVSVLATCASQGNADLCKILIEAKGDIVAGKDNNKTPLFFGISIGSIDVCRVLLSDDKYDLSANGGFFLKKALNNGDIVELLMLNKAQVDAVTFGEAIRNSLYARDASKLKSVEVMLNANVDPNQGTPLVDAAKQKNKNLIKLLLSHGADPTPVVEQGLDTKQFKELLEEATKEKKRAKGAQTE